MILIDYRRGSGELAPFFRQSSIPVEIDTLEFGDFYFTGNGPEGRAWGIGVERKTLGDWIACMRDSRFVGHQLPGMLKAYDRSYLIIEGIYRPDSDGMVEELAHRGKGWMEFRRLFTAGKSIHYGQISNHLNTLRECVELRVIQTSSPQHTAVEVRNLYNWWNSKEYEEHQSHLAEYDPAQLMHGKSSFHKRIAMLIDDVGLRKSRLIDTEFTSAIDMITADERRWLKVNDHRQEKNGRKEPGFSKETIQKILTIFRGGK